MILNLIVLVVLLANVGSIILRARQIGDRYTLIIGWFVIGLLASVLAMLSFMHFSAHTYMSVIISTIIVLSCCFLNLAFLMFVSLHSLSNPTDYKSNFGEEGFVGWRIPNEIASFVRIPHVMEVAPSRLFVETHRWISGVVVRSFSFYLYNPEATCKWCKLSIRVRADVCRTSPLEFQRHVQHVMRLIEDQATLSYFKNRSLEETIRVVKRILAMNKGQVIRHWEVRRVE